MTYDDIAAIFLAPLAEPIPEPDVTTTPARRLRDSLEPIATQGWWSRAAGERLNELGVDFFPGYVWGRAAALGTPPASVVAATFGVFDPGLIGAVYEAGAAATGRDEILAARAAGGAASVGSVASDDECAALAEPLLEALGGLDALGRPLFAALRSLPLPTSPSGRLWRAAELVREHRGDSHLAALVGAGLDAVEANVLTERWLGFGLGEYSATRGFGPDVLSAAVERLEARGWMVGHELTDAGRGARVAIEEATDAGQASLVSALGARLGDVVEGAAEISARLIAARSFPADPRKRAGG
ncbi:MAG: SCO6745 family protein [Acidobacteriota bacterium]